jgi:hypothetical protein
VCFGAGDGTCGHRSKADRNPSGCPRTSRTQIIDLPSSREPNVGESNAPTPLPLAEERGAGFDSRGAQSKCSRKLHRKDAVSEDAGCPSRGAAELRPEKMSSTVRGSRAPVLEFGKTRLIGGQRDVNRCKPCKIVHLPEFTEVGVRFCKPGKRQHRRAKRDTEDSDTLDVSLPTANRQANTSAEPSNDSTRGHGTT